MDDFELLRACVGGRAEDAFAALVRRCLNLVCSAGLRQTRDSQAAEDVSQAVFIIDAKFQDRGL